MSKRERGVRSHLLDHWQFNWSLVILGRVRALCVLINKRSQLTTAFSDNSFEMILLRCSSTLFPFLRPSHFIIKMNEAVKCDVFLVKQ